MTADAGHQWFKGQWCGALMMPKQAVLQTIELLVIQDAMVPSNVLCYIWPAMLQQYIKSKIKRAIL